ncbi:hypothetical protein HED60_23735 [Planctomycetales bacterium ZRK34]|nr:hypothetical protein HED60_23735 [Planctomycetales bacterium ZRK34]
MKDKMWPLGIGKRISDALRQAGHLDDADKLDQALQPKHASSSEAIEGILEVLRGIPAERVRSLPYPQQYDYRELIRQLRDGLMWGKSPYQDWY